MERVAFLLEDSGERLSCLLNPESVVMRRRAGVRPRESLGGVITGRDLADNPLLYTGGGCTTLELDLLFDVSLAGSSILSEDVRILTGPLWELSENARRYDLYKQPPICRFVWGKSWNVPGIVTAVAERLECFSTTGVPGRSWLRLRLMRIVEPSALHFNYPTSQSSGLSTDVSDTSYSATDEETDIHDILYGESASEGSEYRSWSV